MAVLLDKTASASSLLGPLLPQYLKENHWRLVKLIFCGLGALPVTQPLVSKNCKQSTNPNQWSDNVLSLTASRLRSSPTQSVINTTITNVIIKC